MTGLWIAAGIVLFFALTLTVPVHFFVSADEDVRAWMRILFVKIRLFPVERKRGVEKKKKKKSDQRSEKKASAKKKKSVPPKKKKKRDILHMIRLIMKIAQALIKKLARHLRIRVHAYEISVATGDAAKTAVLYGAVTGLSSTLFELLKNVANFKVKRSAAVGVYADFVGEKTKARVKMDFGINLWGVLTLLLAAGLAFVKNGMPRKDASPEIDTAEKPVPVKPDKNKTAE